MAHSHETLKFYQNPVLNLVYFIKIQMTLVLRYPKEKKRKLKTLNTPIFVKLSNSNFPRVVYLSWVTLII